MSFTLIEYEQYTEASAYGDAETCHELCKLAEADRIFFGRSESAESERIFNPRKSTLDTITTEEQNYIMNRNDFLAALAAYAECALWSSSDMNEDGEPIPMDSLDADFAGETLADMARDLTAFMLDPDNAEDLQGLSPEQVGHDFWLTRNGHGTGFWDRGLGERGEALTLAAHAYGEVDLYVGDDGFVYQA